MPDRACRCTASASMLVARDRMPGAGRRGPAPLTVVEISTQDTSRRSLRRRARAARGSGGSCGRRRAGGAAPAAASARSPGPRRRSALKCPRAVFLERPAAVDRHRSLDDVRRKGAARLELGELDDLVPLAEPDLGALLDPVALPRWAIAERFDRHLRGLPGGEVRGIGHVPEDLVRWTADREHLLDSHTSSSPIAVV